MTRTEPPLHAPRRKLFVHIGMHKTGTSSIQYAFHLNHSILKKHGFLYPLTGRHPISHVQHDLIFRALSSSEAGDNLFDLKEPVEADELFQKLRQEISSTKSGSIVISAENLWLLSGQEVENFGNRMSDFDIVPIIFIRRFSDFLESLHLTRVRIEPTYAEIFKSRQDFCKAYGQLDLISCIDNWAKISSSGKVLLHSYDNEERDSIKTFLEILGLSSIKLKDLDKKYNESQSVLSEALRTTLGRNNLSDDLYKGLTKQLSRVNFKEKHTLISEAERNRIDEQYFIQVQQLLSAPNVVTTDRSKWRLAREEHLVHLDGAVSILLAVGRALAEQDPIRS